MSYVQQVEPCADHDGCTVIRCVAVEDIHNDLGGVVYRAGYQIWESHDDVGVDPATRANPDVSVVDRRTR